MDVTGQRRVDRRRNGDFNHDGQVDLLWHNGQSGIVGAWIMNAANGTEVLRRMDLTCQAASSSGWRVVSP